MDAMMHLIANNKRTVAERKTVVNVMKNSNRLQVSLKAYSRK